MPGIRYLSDLKAPSQFSVRKSSTFAKIFTATTFHVKTSRLFINSLKIPTGTGLPTTLKMYSLR